MAKRRCGQYIIGLGKDFELKVPVPTNGYGIDNSLVPGVWYVILASTGKIMGGYTEEQFAIDLAKGLTKRDQKKLEEEMDRILRSSDEA